MTKMVFWKCPITIHSSYVCSATPTFVGVRILFLPVTPSSGAVAPALGALSSTAHIRGLMSLPHAAHGGEYPTNGVPPLI